MNNTHPLLKSSAKINRLTLAVSLLWTSALGSVVLMSLASGGPAGNNGTIKVDNAPFDNDPNNEPHVDCTFQVDFYGYDKGDLWADVIFEQQPPTDGGKMKVTGKTHVFIGEDSNAGGGSKAGLDASETYRLDFSGIDPHPQQGYHVMLTIHADGSQGSDVKHKVFWVEPCSPTPSATPKPTPTGSTTPTPKPTSSTRPTVSPQATGSTTPKPSNSPSPSPSHTPTPSPTHTPTPTVTASTTPGSPTPTSSATPVVGAGSPTPTPGGGGGSPTPTQGGGATPTASPKPAGITDTTTPVQLGAVRIPNVGSAILLVSLILAALLSNIVLVIWTIARQREDRRRIQELVDAGRID